MTPGPWEVQHDGTSICKGSHILARVYYSGHCSYAEDYSNAKLIADAPRLLEVIKELYDYTEPMRDTEYAERARKAFCDAAILLDAHRG